MHLLVSKLEKLMMSRLETCIVHKIKVRRKEKIERREACHEKWEYQGKEGHHLSLTVSTTQGHPITSVHVIADEARHTEHRLMSQLATAALPTAQNKPLLPTLCSCEEANHRWPTRTEVVERAWDGIDEGEHVAFNGVKWWSFEGCFVLRNVAFTEFWITFSWFRQQRTWRGVKGATKVAYLISV